jgi:putative aldouronate transport system permease protein
MEQSIVSKEDKKKKIGFFHYVRNHKMLYILLAPGLLFFLIFKYLPMGGIVIAFQDYVPFTGILGSKWVGLSNFYQLFGGNDFKRLMTNTLIIAFLNIVIVFPAPIILALLLNELRKKLLGKMIQTAIYLPHFLSWTIVASITLVLLNADNGGITDLVQSLTGKDIDFLGNPGFFRPMIIIQSIWKECGWGTIIYLAALAGVSQEQYEAAIMDGAGRFSRIWHVTLPGIRSTIVIMLILKCGSILNTGFDQIYQMTNSLNRSVADVFDTYVYTMGITNSAYSYSTAVGLFKSVVGMILVLFANKIANLLGESGLY